jgi:hypothetical protein
VISHHDVLLPEPPKLEWFSEPVCNVPVSTCTLESEGVQFFLLTDDAESPHAESNPDGTQHTDHQDEQYDRLLVAPVRVAPRGSRAFRHRFEDYAKMLALTPPFSEGRARAGWGN